MGRLCFRPATLALALAGALTACSGGTMGGQTVVDTADALIARPTGSQNAHTGIAAATALGGRIRQLAFVARDDAWNVVRFAPTTAAAIAHLGRCEDGIELFAPDRKGDANSTEEILFYDRGCSQISIDDVRLYTPTGSNSETVAHATSLYAPNSSAAAAVATSNSSISNATIGSFGLPNVAAGFTDVTTGQLVVGSTHVLSAGSELVVSPGTHAAGSFCGDSAGFDPAGIASLDETFGWQGVLSGGLRKTSGNGFLTLSATPSGTAFSAPIGSFSVAQGTRNTSCPIGTPDFTLAGGSALGAYSIPITIRFHRGELWSVSVQNAMLPNGDTLNVQTNRALRQGNRAFITGAIDSGKTPVAVFAVNAFGNGTLTVVSTGAVYKIVDWVVVQ